MEAVVRIEISKVVAWLTSKVLTGEEANERRNEDTKDTNSKEKNRK